MSVGKQLSLIVVPDDNSGMRSYKVSYALLYTFAGLVGIFIITFVFFVVTYAHVLNRAQRVEELMVQNASLIGRSAQLDSLRSELVQLQAMGIQIKNMMGIDISKEDSMLVANLSPVANSPSISDASELAEGTTSEQRSLLKAIPSLWPVKGYVTRGFYTTGGEKSDQYHPGMDIAAKRNTPIQAAAEGVVVASDWDETYGYRVILDHGFGITSLYGHNARNLVRAGDRVARGQTIAFLGSTGKSSAPHLHFEVMKNGVPVNPSDYLLN